jgi:DNA polymerase III epsilon subunit-like protein
MLYTIFDLETTGFSGTADSVCQFAFMTVNHNLLPVRARNYYFYKEGMSWSEEAAAVHGLTREFLKQHEKDYEKNLLSMYTVLQRGNLVGHNSNQFDIPFARQFLIREGFPPLQPEICYDTMQLWKRHFGKRMKLSNLPAELGIKESQIHNLASIMFKDAAGDLRSHNACYDVAATACCLRVAVAKGLCSLQPVPATAQKSMSSLSI